MSIFSGASRTIVIRTSRDTLGLFVAASAVTFAMAYAVHSKHERVTPPAAPEAHAPLQDWAGHLAELAPATAPAPSEPMTSAALVVPTAQLALQSAPIKLPVKRPCLEIVCAARTPATPTTPVATAASPKAAVAVRAAREAKRTLLGTLNPLNHLPDMATVRRPFSYASNTVAGWFKRL